MSNLIYIADDEKNIRELTKMFLIKEGYLVNTYENGESLLKAFDEKPADLIILDIMMPGLDGLTICSLLRQSSSVPIIIVSARDSEIDKVTGITIGSDDYLTKPFSPLELVARVKAIFRRIDLENKSLDKSSIENNSFGDLIIHKEYRSITRYGETLDVTQLEFSILSYLFQNSYRAVSREELLRNVWKFNYDTVDTRATDDAIKRIRKKLSDIKSKVKIETVRGYGFRLNEVELNEEEAD